MMADGPQARRELCRHEVLRYLAARAVLCHSLAAIVRGVNRSGFDFQEIEVREALALLSGLALVQSTPDPLGATPTYQITGKGTIEYERI
jgi:hypothetical protein